VPRRASGARTSSAPGNRGLTAVRVHYDGIPACWVVVHWKLHHCRPAYHPVVLPVHDLEPASSAVEGGPALDLVQPEVVASPDGPNQLMAYLAAEHASSCDSSRRRPPLPSLAGSRSCTGRTTGVIRWTAWCSFSGLRPSTRYPVVVDAYGGQAAVPRSDDVLAPLARGATSSSCQTTGRRTCGLTRQRARATIPRRPVSTDRRCWSTTC